ncbi:MAG: DUF3127 domain-containing protein [Muribaculum sp.]|nr:DUF3127 domain-containing protein [Muribaculum sp.]
MANQMTGRIFIIQPTQSIPTKSGGTFYKREIVLDCTRFDPYTGERGYDNYPVFEFSNDRCSLLDAFQPGDVVTISFDIQGTKSSQGDRYFNSVRGYKIEHRGNAQAQPQQSIPQSMPQQVAPQPQYAAPAYAAPPTAPYGDNMFGPTDPNKGLPF